MRMLAILAALGGCGERPCGDRDYCACVAEPACLALTEDCFCPCDAQCGDEADGCACVCGGGEYLGCDDRYR